jgi:hypothetical protein
MKEHRMTKPSKSRIKRPSARVGRSISIDSSPVYRRRRAVLGLLLALVLAGSFTAFATQGQAQASSESSADSFTYVTVHSGETLWSVAEEHAGATDTREWIAQLITLNALQDNQLQPGQRIALPTQ